MTLKSDVELSNTREKLRELEDRYEARRRETPANPHVHELTLRALKRFINQLKEQVVLYEACGPGRGGPNPIRLKNDVELANTREKLRRLEAMYEADENDTDGDDELHEFSAASLKRFINQLKEEIVRYETRQPAPR